jgi:hypothetical protein
MPSRAKKQAEMFQAPWPKEIDTPEARTAIVLWLTYRTKRKLGTYTDIGFAALLRKLAKWGPERTIAAIEHSMAENYQGIYEERTVGQPVTKVQMTTSRNKNIERLKERISR